MGGWVLDTVHSLDWINTQKELLPRWVAWTGAIITG